MLKVLGETKKPEIVPTCPFYDSLYCSNDDPICYSQNPEFCEHYGECSQRYSDDWRPDKTSVIDKITGGNIKRRESVHKERFPGEIFNAFSPPVGRHH